MDYLITKLNNSHMNDLLTLFVHCFFDTPYYTRLFPSEKTREKQMTERFFSAISYCVKTGGAYGMYDDGILISFILYFDYKNTKIENERQFRDIFYIRHESGEFLPYKDSLHDKIDSIEEDVLFFMSLGVHADYRGRGIAGSLVDFVLAAYPCKCFVTDIASDITLNMCKNRGFCCEQIDTGYYFAKRKAILLAIPDKSLVNTVSELAGADAQQTEISGFRIDKNNFIKSPGETCSAYLISVSFDQLLAYQRYINLACHTEEFVELDDGAHCRLYACICENNNRLWNDRLRELVVNREHEWSVIADVHILIPVEYSKDKLSGFQKYDKSDKVKDDTIKILLTYLDFRTHWEEGTPKGVEIENDPDNYKNRIDRYYIEKLKIIVTDEISPDTINNYGVEIGTPAEVDIILSVDNQSKCGVLSIISLSSPFLLSHLLDKTICNQLLVEDEDKRINFYEYLKKYNIKRRGTAKSFITIPKSKESTALTTPEIASILVSETIFPKGEGLGEFADSDILQIADTNYGQYGHAHVCVYSNVLIDFSEGLHCSTVKDRLDVEAITHFYIELLLFEEAAIHIADHNIITSLSDRKKTSERKFLQKTMKIHDEYAKTIEFWDIKVNYPSSQKSVSMIRNAFKLDEQINTMKRNADELQVIFETKRDIMDRTDAAILNYIVLFLTLVQGIAIFVPSLFSDNSGLRENIIGTGAVALLIALYALLKRQLGRWK